MANIETIIDEMMTQLNDLKDIAIDGNVSAVGMSEVNVQSMTSDKVVIHFNLNKELNESSVCDKSPENKDPDNNCHKTDPDVYSGAKSQNSANPSKPSDNSNNSGSQPPADNTYKSRSYRRTISESMNEERSRGILKFSNNWMRRTVSESSCDVFPADLDLLYNYQSIEDMFSDDGDDYYERKAKKNVRFSDNVSKTIFRPNSSILGRKSKNQKRAKNRKNRKNSENSDSETKMNDNSDTERIRQDSGYDSEDNGLNSNPVMKAHTHNDINDIETGIENLMYD